jgi:hypothetical protein
MTSTPMFIRFKWTGRGLRPSEESNQDCYEHFIEELSFQQVERIKI